MFCARTLCSGLLVFAIVAGIGTCDRASATEILQGTWYLDSGAPADALLIQDLIRNGQLDKAMIAVEALEKKQPKSPLTFNLKGTVYAEKDDLVNARKSFERAAALDASSTAASINLAQLDLKEKKPDAARQRLQGILAKDNKNYQAMLGLASVAAATGQEAEYLDWLVKAAAAAPYAVQPRMFLAEYYLRKDDPRKALAIAREAQIAGPSSAEALELLGTVQLFTGEKENAVVTFAKWVALTPNDPVAHFKLAGAQAAVPNVAAARASLGRALALKPNYLDAEVLLASIDLGAERYGDALNTAQRIQEQYPRSAAGFGLQGNILMAQKQYGPALKAYERAWAITRSGALAVRIHQALAATGNTKEADARILQWLKDEPKDVTARAYFAATSLKAGDNKQAVDQYQLLLQADPNNLRALNDLAWLYQQAKDPRALATAEQAYKVKSDSPEVMDTLGWILVEQGKSDRGLALLQQAVQKAPASVEIRYHLAVALAKSGDVVRARKELEDLLAKNKQFPQRQEAEALLRQL